MPGIILISEIVPLGGLEKGGTDDSKCEIRKK